MKNTHSHRLTLTLTSSRTLALTLVWAATLCLPAQAADAVFQRQSASETIELSNLEEAGSGQAVLIEGAPHTAAAPSAPLARPQAHASNATLRGKRLNAKGQAGTEAAADAESDASTEDSPAEERALASDEQTDPSALASPQNQGAGTDKTASGASPMTGGGAGFSAPYNQGANSTAGGGSGSSGIAGSGGAGTGTPGTGTTGTTASSGGSGSSAGTGAAPLSGLQAMLSQYRDLMVQEASAANYMNSNPAISRRYLAVNRTTYQARMGQ